MIHLGDITKISGYTAPVVDCIIGGSPCQDLSVAGKRAGLEGQRSGLFMQQIRIIKEMRENDRRNGRAAEYVRPRYMVWENVPGAFSSNKGEDFRIVLEETAKVADENASIPRPEKGKWSTSGCILADGWSIAWRVFDAQFWGVPQRRRRIALVADFGGQSAPEVLFVRKSLSGDSEPGESGGKGASSDTERSSGASDCERPSISFQERGGKPGGGKGILIQEDHMAIAYSVENHPADSRVDIDESGKVQTLTGRMGTGAGNVPMVIDLDRASYNQGHNAQFDIGISEDGVAHTCIAKGPGAVAYAIDHQGGKGMCGCAEDICPTICSDSHGTPRAVAYLDGSQTCGTLTANNAGGNQRMPDKDNFNCVVQAVDCRNCSEDDVNGALQSNMAHSLNGNNVVRVRYIVRRLTPLECERLQGYPDGWTDIGEYTNSKGKKCKASDASRYKALGNSIALPSWKWVLKRICGCYERDATLGSLFDGIGGFGYLWQQINGKGSCLWASEIEEFPIAVTKERIG